MASRKNIYLALRWQWRDNESELCSQLVWEKSMTEAAILMMMTVITKVSMFIAMRHLSWSDSSYTTLGTSLVWSQSLSENQSSIRSSLTPFPNPHCLIVCSYSSVDFAGRSHTWTPALKANDGRSIHGVQNIALKTARTGLSSSEYSSRWRKQHHRCWIYRL